MDAFVFDRQPRQNKEQVIGAGVSRMNNPRPDRVKVLSPEDMNNNKRSPNTDLRGILYRDVSPLAVKNFR
jgi:hypothetical protein